MQPLPWHSSQFQRKCTDTYLGFGFNSPMGPQEQERKTMLVSQRHLLSHLDPKPTTMSQATPPSSTGCTVDHPPAKRHAVSCPSVCQSPRHMSMLLTEQKGVWYLLTQAKGQTLPPQRGRRMDTSPSPGSCSRSPSPPVENMMLWLPKASPAVHPAHGHSGVVQPGCSPLPCAYPHCKTQLHPSRMNRERADPSQTPLTHRQARKAQGPLQEEP